MLAVVTGASSGIGFEVAKHLSKIGYEIIAIGQNRERLQQLKSECITNVVIEVLDLTDTNNCINLVTKYSDMDVDILINSAGIGAIGEFENISLDKELKMIDINIKASHIITKGFLKNMISRNKGYIVNVSSSAAFAPGPLMATYYATKDYIYKLTVSINKELRKKNSKVIVSVLCPGPVNTNFNNNLGIDFSVKPISAEYVAKYTIKNMFKNKKVIIPGIKNKLGVLASKILPDCILEEYIYNMQLKKIK